MCTGSTEPSSPLAGVVLYPLWELFAAPQCQVTPGCENVCIRICLGYLDGSTAAGSEHRQELVNFPCIRQSWAEQNCPCSGLCLQPCAAGTVPGVLLGVPLHGRPSPVPGTEHARTAATRSLHPLSVWHSRSGTSCLTRGLGAPMTGEGSDAAVCASSSRLLCQPHTKVSLQPQLHNMYDTRRVDFFSQSYLFPPFFLHCFLLVFSATRCYSPLTLLARYCCSALV